MSVTKRIKYFKQIAILLTIFWTILTTLFLVYQFYNEEKHSEASSVEKLKGVAEQSVAFIYWAYEQKAKALSDEQKYTISKNFSLKELLNVLTQKSGIELKIEPLGKTIDEKKEDNFRVININKEKHLVYVKPLIANQYCIACHVHDESNVGDLLGFASMEMKIPSFKEVNPQSYYFLIMMYLGTWLLGLFAIWWIHLKGKNYLNEKMEMYEESVYALVDMMEKRDSYTAGHSQRVAEYSKTLTLALGHSLDDADLIYKAGMLHDIGKIEIPDAILLKPEKLLPIEYSLIQRHSLASYELLSREPFSLLARIVLHHHEKYDGSGYPHGLKEDKIPFLSQVIAVADAFDAMTTNRSYRKSLTREAAIAILEEESGKQFNPLIVKVAKEVFKSVELPNDTTQMPRDLLEEMRFSYYFKDQLTGYYNLNYLKFIFAHLDDCKSKMIRIDHLNCVDFASFNKKYGWKKGDELLCSIAKAIAETYPSAIIMRVYSDNFFVLHLDQFTPMSCARVYNLIEENGLQVVCKHLDLDTDDAISFDILEDKLLHLEN